jgi:hypothetical protein
MLSSGPNQSMNITAINDGEAADDEDDAEPEIPSPHHAEV